MTSLYPTGAAAVRLVSKAASGANAIADFKPISSIFRYYGADASSQWARSSEERRAEIELHMTAAAAAGDVAAAGACMQARVLWQYSPRYCNNFSPSSNDFDDAHLPNYLIVQSFITNHRIFALLDAPLPPMNFLSGSGDPRNNSNKRGLGLRMIL